MKNEKWNKHFNVSDDEWKSIIEKAMSVWDTLEMVKDPDFTLETETCPMHPSQFFQLSSVSGFNEMNGYTYEEYVENWRKRTQL